MKYDKDRGGYVLSRKEVEDLESMMHRAKRMCEDLEYLQALRLALPSSSGRKLPN